MDLEALAALLAASHRSVYFKRRSEYNGGGAVRPLSSARQLLGVALAGGLGGLINATLCYAGWPVSVTLASFHWHVYTPTRPRLGKALIVGTAAGVLGSLGFWIGDRWYFSLL